MDRAQPASDTSEVAQFIEQKGPCVSYVSFRVDDIDAAAEHAAKCGLREISRFGFGSMKQVQFDTMDLLGFMLEFVEYAHDWDQQVAEIKRRLGEGETVNELRYVDL